MILKRMARGDRNLLSWIRSNRNARRAQVGLGLVFLFEIGKTVVGAVEMWKSRRWRFPRAGGGGGKLDVSLG